MNIDMIRKLADYIEALPDPRMFQQYTWHEEYDCGTAACVAGHCGLMLGAKVPKSTRMTAATIELGGNSHTLIYHKRRVNVLKFAKHHLGLTSAQAIKLFNGNAEGWPQEYRERYISARADSKSAKKRQAAVDMLRAIADGKVTL